MSRHFSDYDRPANTNPTYSGQRFINIWVRLIFTAFINSGRGFSYSKHGLVSANMIVKQEWVANNLKEEAVMIEFLWNIAKREAPNDFSPRQICDICFFPVVDN